MRWTHRALVMRACAALPGGPRAYRVLQRTAGRLDHDPLRRIPDALAIAQQIIDDRGSLAGLTLFEVGTGHLPFLPIILALLGAKAIHTIDRYRRLDVPTLRRTLITMKARRDEIESACVPLVDSAHALSHRFDRLEESVNAPFAYLESAGITYHAPADAANVELDDATIDVHFSHATLEHIAPDSLLAIFREAQRLLAAGGSACHLIDLSDHFSHTDPDVPVINFLRYSEADWQRIAGNQFAYCSRLRKSQYTAIFESAGFYVEQDQSTIDTEEMARITREKAAVHSDFNGLLPEDLATVVWRVRLRSNRYQMGVQAADLSH